VNSYSAGVRAQVFEVIVRQAMAGAPWREICAGPMQVNNISAEDVEAECNRRRGIFKKNLPAEKQKQITECINSWKERLTLLQKPQEQLPLDIDTLVSQLYQISASPPPKIVVACESPLRLFFYSKAFDLARSSQEELRELARAVAQQPRIRQDQSMVDGLIAGFESLQKRLPDGIGKLLTPKFHNEGFTVLTKAIQTKINRHADISTYLHWGLVTEIGSFITHLVNPIITATISIEGATPMPEIAARLDAAVADLNIPMRLRDRIQAAINSSVGGDNDIPTLSEHLWGIWRAPNIIGHSLVQEELQSECPLEPAESGKLEVWVQLIEAAPWYAFFEHVCFVGVSPSEVVLNAQMRTSNPSGPAIVYPDGFKVWVLEGAVAPRKLVECPLELNVEDIDEEPNAALRRLMIEAYGVSRYLIDTHAELIHSDESGELYRKELQRDEPIVMVCVTNKTPEPDGSYKKYFLRVPPNITTAKDAVAWTFDQPTEEYKPAQET